MLKESGYQENIISKIFQVINFNHTLSLSEKQPEATDIQEEEMKMNINLPCVERINEKVQRILISHK